MKWAKPGMRNYGYLIVVVIAAMHMFWCMPVQAEEYGRIRFEHVGSSHRTGQAIVQCIAQDADGFMWFGTRHGLYRFDGESFKQYVSIPGDPNSLSSNNIVDIVVSRSGQLWMTTDSGELDRFDPDSERIEHFNVPTSEPGAVFTNPIIGLIRTENSPWVLTRGGGLTYLNEKNGRFIIHEDNPVEVLNVHKGTCVPLLEDSAGNLWFRLPDGQFASINRSSSSFRTYRTLADVDIDAASWGSSFVFRDSADCIWISIYGLGLFMLEPDGNQPLLMELPEGAKSESIFEAFEDTGGDVWFCSDRELFSYSRDTGSFTLVDPFGVDDSQSSPLSIFDVFIDRSGTVWLGTSRGIWNYSRYKYKFDNQLNEEIFGERWRGTDVLSVFKDNKGNVWLGTLKGGITKLDRNANLVTNYAIDSNEASDSIVLSIVQDRSGGMYLGTAGNGIVKFNPAENQFHSISAQQQVTDILEQSDSRLRFATFVNGIGSYTPENARFEYWSPQPSRQQIASTYDFNVLYLDSKGNLWAGADGGGLVCEYRDGSSYSIFTHDRNAPDSISDNRILAVTEDNNGSLWVGTRNGLNILAFGSETFQHLYQSDGLPSNEICGLVFDDSGTLWISTTAGLARYDPTEKTMSIYTTNDGLPGNEFLPGSYHKAPDGEIFLGGVNGVVSFRPSALEYNPYPPNVVITSIRVFDKAITFSKEKSASVELSYTENSFEFEFAALDFSNPRNNRYQYRLAGLHDDWIDAGSTRIARYNGVSPGTYVFNVRASNNDGVWSESEASVTIRIFPPFWMTWWFRLLAGLTLVAVVLSFFFIRMRSVQKQRDILQAEVEERKIVEKELLTHQKNLRLLASKLTLAEEIERRRIAQLLHDKIGHGLLLSKVKLTSHLGDLDDSRLRTPLEDVIGTIDEALQDTRTLTVEISPPSLYKYGLESAAEHLIERFGSEYGLRTIVSIGKKSSVSQSTAVLLYQALRELMVNIVKHAEAEIVKAAIYTEGDTIYIKLQDDGKGFDSGKELITEDHSEGFGLFSIRERMENIGGRMIINSTPGKGTKIILSAPLKAASEI